MLTPNQLLSLDTETLEIITDPQPRDPELARKLVYLSEQLLNPERAADKTFLLAIKRDLLRHNRPH